MEEVQVYTDGACLKNPGKGGWGAVIVREGSPQEQLSGFESETTNNRMEMMAAIRALQHLQGKPGIQIILHTDSIYLKDGITSWIKSWKKNNWKTSQKKPVKNVDLWQELDALNSKINVKWQWVKGHSGDKYNTIADGIAHNAAVKQAA